MIVWLPLPCEILGNMCILIVCKPGCDVVNFEIKIIFLIKPFSPHEWPESHDKILRTERAFKMKQGAFFINFKGLSIKQIKQFFLKGQSPTLTLEEKYITCYFSSKNKGVVKTLSSIYDGAILRKQLRAFRGLKEF